MRRSTRAGQAHQHSALSYWTGTFLAWLAISSIPSSAQAHANAFPEANDVLLFHGDETQLGIEASFGVLLADDGVNFDWVCHETVTSPLASALGVVPQYAANGNGVLLATTQTLVQGRDPRESLYRSTDGCTWDVTFGLLDQLVGGMAFHPLVPDQALAVTGTMMLGVQNAIYSSDDAGQTWSVNTPIDAGFRFRSVIYSANGDVAWATSYGVSPLSTQVHRSTDAGLSWEIVTEGFEVDGIVQVQIDILAATDDGQEAWLRVRGNWHDVLLRTTDGGTNFVTVLSLSDSSQILDAVLDTDGSIWVTTTGDGLQRAFDGATFAPVASSPGARGVAVDDRGLLVAAAANEAQALQLSCDRVAFQGLLAFNQITGLRNCAVGSHTRDICEPLWDQVATTLKQFETDEETPDTGADCDDDDSAGDDDDSTTLADSDGQDEAEEPEGAGCSCSSAPTRNVLPNRGSSFLFCAFLAAASCSRRRERWGHSPGPTGSRSGWTKARQSTQPEAH